MFTVQKIGTTLYERQRLIEYDGPPEALGDWLEAMDDEPAIVETGLRGLGCYTRLVCLLDVDDTPIYYLVPDVYFVGDGDEALFAGYNLKEAQAFAVRYNASREENCNEACVYAISADELPDMPGGRYIMQELGLL